MSALCGEQYSPCFAVLARAAVGEGELFVAVRYKAVPVALQQGQPQGPYRGPQLVVRREAAVSNYRRLSASASASRARSGTVTPAPVGTQRVAAESRVTAAAPMSMGTLPSQAASAPPQGLRPAPS